MLVGRSSWSKISNSAPAESLFGGVIRAGRCNSSPGLSLEPAKGSEAGGAPGLLHGALACPAATSNSPRFAVWDERRRVPKGVLTSGLLGFLPAAGSWDWTPARMPCRQTRGSLLSLIEAGEAGSGSMPGAGELPGDPLLCLGTCRVRPHLHVPCASTSDLVPSN